MATLDWPADRCFQPQPDSDFGLRVPNSSFSGFFTGAYQSLAHASDRWVAKVLLGPCNAADGQKREAFFNRLLIGDDVRLPHILRRSALPSGSLRSGTLTLSAQALGGVRSISVAGASNANLLTKSRTMDDAAWQKVGVTVTANNHGDPIGTTTSDGVVENGATSGHFIFQNVAVGAATGAITFSGWLTNDTRSWVWLQMEDLGTGNTATVFFNLSGAGSASLAGASGSWSGLSATIVQEGAYWRVSMTATKGSASTNINAIIGASTNGSTTSYAGNSSAAFAPWGFKVARESVATTPYPTLLAGDMLGLGTFLLQASTDCVAGEDGALTVPLNNAVRATQAIGAAVTYTAPTARMVIPSDSIIHRGGRSSWHRALELVLVEAA